eukprot:2407108-Rhodomonas_salina.2
MTCANVRSRPQASASPSPSSPRGRLLLKLQVPKSVPPVQKRITPVTTASRNVPTTTGRVKDLEVSLKQRTARMDQLSRAASPGQSAMAYA